MLGMVPLLIIPFLALQSSASPACSASRAAIPSPPRSSRVTMMSGGVWTMTVGSLLVTVALLLLFVEIMKSTRSSNASIVDHLLSTFVFVAFLVEFLLVRGAAHPVFFTLMMITLVDVLAGFSVSIRSAGRDVR